MFLYHRVKMKIAVDILVIDTDVYTISQVLVTSFSQNIMPFDFLSFHFKKKSFLVLTTVDIVDRMLYLITTLNYLYEKP